MQLRRARHLFSPRRLQACKKLFAMPVRSFLGTAFLTHRPRRLTLRNGRSLVFSRSGRDHVFWDWYLRKGAGQIDFTRAGEILLAHRHWKLFLRPGTADFYSFREIFLYDAYGLQGLPGNLGTVIDLGGNVGLFSCALLPRARRVITVEPVLANFNQAVKNVTANGGNADDLFRFAVTDRSGDEINVLRSSRNTCQHSLYSGLIDDANIEAQEKVPTISLPDLLNQADCDSVDLVKCDIEGGEFDVFRGTPRPVLRRIRRLIMEVHLSPEHPRSALETLTKRIGHAGFELHYECTGKRRGNELGMLTCQRRPERIFACAG